MSDKMSTLLSLVVPSYNMEMYLAQCVGSVFSCPKDVLDLVEVIVVNDGSKDKTSDIAHALAVNAPCHFFVVDKENGHYGSCVNAALPLIKGRYFKILDADDTLDPNEFAQYVRGLAKIADRESIPDAVITEAVVVDAEGKSVSEKEFSYGEDWRIDELKSIPDCLIRDLHLFMLTYRTGIFGEIVYRQTERVSYTDTQLAMVPFLRVKTISFCHKKIYRYLYGREGQSMSPEVLAATQIPANIKIAIDSLRMYLKNIDLAASAYNSSYVKSRIVSMMRTVYEWGLLSSKLGRWDKQLAEFDAQIKELSSDVYTELSLCTMGCIKVPYIRLWRMRRSSWCVSFLFAMFFRRLYRRLFR